MVVIRDPRAYFVEEIRKHFLKKYDEQIDNAFYETMFDSIFCKDAVPPEQHIYVRMTYVHTPLNREPNLESTTSKALQIRYPQRQTQIFQNEFKQWQFWADLDKVACL